MKQIIITIIKFIGFFIGWAILTFVLPLSASENPAIWRLWAEIKQKHNIVAATIVTTVLFTALHGGALVLGGVSLADDYSNLYITAFTGNDILSGGSCKIEGSIIVLFVNIILITFFGYLKNKRIS